MWFMITLPLRTATIVVVGKYLMIVYVATGEQGTPARTAHRCGRVGMSQLGSLVPYSLQGTWHEV